MAILGNNTTPSSGSWFDVTGNKQYWQNHFLTMPAGGGIATDINVYCAGDGSTVTGQLLVWDNSNNIFWQSGNITLPSGTRSIGGQSWVHASIANVYFPAGSYAIGFWSSGHVVWTFESTAGVNGKSGVASPSTITGGSDEYAGQGFGELGGYVVYTPGGGARVNTGTPGSPNWVFTPVQVNLGTPGAPNWQFGTRTRVNIGTPGSPNWVDCT